MKKTFVLLLSLGIGAAVQAQSLERFKSELGTPDEQYRSQATVREHGEAATAVRSLSARTAGSTVRGYRVRIFVDNGQNARPLAEDACKRFSEIYPDVPTYLDYDAPYFRVTVGNCRTSEEAIILWGRIKDAFDRAFLVREEIPVELFGVQEPAAGEPVSETEPAEQPAG